MSEFMRSQNVGRQNYLIVPHVRHVFPAPCGGGGAFNERKPADRKALCNRTVATKGLGDIILKRLNTDSEQA